MLQENKLTRERHFISVGDFNCGPDNPLNTFISDDAFRYAESRHGITYVLTMPENPNQILGFYTLKSSGIQVYDADNNEFNSTPAVEISRIAVQYDIQQQGIGKYIFYTFILPKIKKVSEIIAVKVIIAFVEPDDEQAVHFYNSLGFEKATDVVQKEIADSFNNECDLYIVSLGDAGED